MPFEYVPNHRSAASSRSNFPSRSSIRLRQPVTAAQAAAPPAPGDAPRPRRLVLAIGIGGIMRADAALEFLLAGCAAVQVGTATFVNPRAIADPDHRDAHRSRRLVREV